MMAARSSEVRAWVRRINTSCFRCGTIFLPTQSQVNRARKGVRTFCGVNCHNEQRHSDSLVDGKKLCRGCGLSKDPSAFNTRGERRPVTRCKLCSLAAKRSRYAERPAHREETKRRARQFSQGQRDGLSDSYIAAKLGLALSQTPSALIDSKRLQLLISRTLRKLDL